MAAYKLTDFSDIYNAVLEELKVQSSDTTSLNRIKRMVNMIYLDEVVPASRWFWLYGKTSVYHKSAYYSGTVSVTPNSAAITLSVAPTSAEGASGSFLNYQFSVDGTNEIYTISAHTALSTSITLDRAYNGVLAATANFKIWKEYINLPTDLRETVEVWHDHSTVPLEAKGLQEFRRIVTEQPKAELRPYYYCTYDYVDPSMNDGETESDRYRVMKLHPAISIYNTSLHIDYIKEATPLDVAGDEPLMPIEDRIVLFYGALSLAWGSIGRNPEEAARNRALFDNKLARMMGKVQDSMDKPRIEPDSSYIVAKRGPKINGLARRPMGSSSGGQSTYSAPTYLAGVTINGANITGNVTVASGITIDGRDISADATFFDSHIAASSDVHGLSSGASVVGTTSSQVLTNKSIDADTNTITNIENADIKSGAAIARNKIANGTASRVVVNDGSGTLSDSAITTTELSYLDNIEPVTSATLTDNTASATNVATWAHASYEAVVINYSLARGAGNRETGQLLLATDGTSVAIAQTAASVGTLGTTFTADISGTDLRLRYITTSTGTDVTMKYTLQKWI